MFQYSISFSFSRVVGSLLLERLVVQTEHAVQRRRRGVQRYPGRRANEARDGEELDQRLCGLALYLLHISEIARLTLRVYCRNRH